MITVGEGVSKMLMYDHFRDYHLLVKRKPYERIDLLITARVNIYQIKIPIVMKACSS